MKRYTVAILLPWLKMGGTNKIALNFIRDLSEYCDVTLVLSENTGELLSKIPSDTKVLTDIMVDLPDLVKEDLHRFRFLYLLKDTLYYYKVKTGNDGVDNYKYIVDRQKAVSDIEFDCAISYHGQSPERLLNLLYRIHAKKRVVWIHGEMSFPDRIINEMGKYYSKIDHFFFVSDATRESFARYYPFVNDRATIYYNPIDRQEILQEAEASFPEMFSNETTNILTVGRLSKEKGQEMIPAITRLLMDEGFPVTWYIIGDGDLLQTVKEAIDRYDVKEQVVLLGTKLNPYCYMKACDIYVQPSYTEGYSTTICEAGILGKAIIGTKPSGGIREQIIDGEDGLIVEAEVHSLENAIKLLLESKELRQKFENNIKEKNFEGKNEINKFINYLMTNFD